eukprot:gnl/Dysnectes_brevis/4832_a6680_695.p1 GENE.gnl/Dysnectes_brevis/4832_a6680_695~~gnl/Dysnectes_brevis/4832_a6680_695.p1  ORF type:complete len:169 (-),score=1.69 gnl/Dysnectes_brevis/4832_a6680_695:52-558(-)
MQSDLNMDSAPEPTYTAPFPEPVPIKTPDFDNSPVIVSKSPLSRPSPELMSRKKLQRTIRYRKKIRSPTSPNLPPNLPGYESLPSIPDFDTLEDSRTAGRIGKPKKHSPHRYRARMAPPSSGIHRETLLECVEAILPPPPLPTPDPWPAVTATYRQLALQVCEKGSHR